MGWGGGLGVLVVDTFFFLLFGFCFLSVDYACLGGGGVVKTAPNVAVRF